MNSHPLLGEQPFDPELDAERDSSARRCCILKVGRASIRISLGLAVWVFALLAALSPKSSGIIVLANSLNAVFLGIIAPAGLYMLLKPVHLDFGDSNPPGGNDAAVSRRALKLNARVMEFEEVQSFL